ncbi:Conserved hypothetical protein 698, partial [Roseovarius pacificus]
FEFQSEGENEKDVLRQGYPYAVDSGKPGAWPFILTLGALATRTRAGQDAEGSVPMPWFVFGFAAVVLVNSVLSIPAEITRQIATWTAFLLTMALAAMGLETDLAKLHLKGLRPLLLGAIGWIFISVFGLALILWL